MTEIAAQVTTRSAMGQVRLAFGLPILSLLFMQKIALPLGDTQVSLLVPVLMLAMMLLALSGRLELVEMRLALFLSFLAAFCFSQVLVVAPVSLASIGLLVALYTPACFAIALSEDEWRAIRGDFQRAVLALGLIVWLQLAWQFLHGDGNTLNLEHIVPDQLLLQGYVYAVPFRWGAHFVRPNGIFMLEPSFVSLFLGCGLLIEMQERRASLPRLVLLGSALLGTLAGTGFMALAMGAPLLLLRLKPKSRLGLIALTLAALVAAALAGILDVFVYRLGEFGTPGSSVWLRFVEPFRQLVAALGEPSGLITGIGAGNVSDTQMNAWPFLKLALEYGVLSALLFLAYLCVAMWGSPVPPALFALFVIYNFSGGYLLTPVVPLLLVLLGSLPRPAPAARPNLAPEGFALVR